MLKLVSTRGVMPHSSLTVQSAAVGRWGYEPVPVCVSGTILCDFW